MADETISTRIVANADFSNLIADVHKVTASLSKLQQELVTSNARLASNVAAINRSFGDTLRSTGQFSTHFVSLTSDVEKFGKNLDGGRLKLRDYFSTFQTHVRTSGGLIRDLAKQQVAMQNAILQPLGRNSQGLMQFNVHVPRGLDAIKNKTSLARQELQIMNKVIQDGAVQLINWGKNTQWAGRQLTVGLTLPLAAFGKAAADAFRVADQELTRLAKVYGDVAGTSAAELKRVREEVVATSKELSAAYGTNFAETIALGADIAATGKTGQELLGSIKETTRLAVLGEVDRQEAMKATLAIQSAFKANTDQLAESINFLNAVENQTSTTLNDLVEAIPKAGPVIKGLGGDIQDLALYLTAMREGGVSASEGANALKSALASLINPTDVAVNKFKGFGIDLLGIVRDNAGDVTATLFALQAALDKLNPLQKQQAIEQLFGKFQFSRLNALFENLGRQGSQTLQVLDLMKSSAADLEQVAARELTALTESASGKYRRALESLKADLAGLGDSFLTIGTQLINIVSKALEFFQELPKPIKQALTFVGALTALAGPIIMLTGVLANFFGYILKGIGHMKAFFKGGEGWKYLTPEMLAAEKAGQLVEQTFYSDAKAAAILQTALRNLIDEFSVLEAKAKSGAQAVNPAVSTMAGNLIISGGRGSGTRVVDPNHPLAGAIETRASTHMRPRAGLSEQERLAQTFFGFVPGSIPLNRKIGDNPQIYMNEPLPPVPGLTTIGGASTGVVASEAARWHSMMATLAMQSKQEIVQLKKQIADTGIVSKDFMMQFDDILPIVSGITDNAAKQSSLIVAELRAGKISVEAARARIVTLNAEIEAMIATAMSTHAAAMGRTINPTMVPTLNQPVVDPTGKSNMRELFKKSKTRDFIDGIARSLGVKTWGAGYNIETTKPKKFNMGGGVYFNNGDQVPGPNVNADVVPAMLTPGEFVIRRDVAQQDPEGMRALNAGQAVIVPIQGANMGGMIQGIRGYNAGALVAAARRIVPTSALRNIFQGRFRPDLSKSEYEVKGTQGVFGSTFTNPVVARAINKILSSKGRKPVRGNTISRQKINAEMKYGPGVPPDVLLLSMMSGTGSKRTSADVLLQALVNSGKMDPARASQLSNEIFEEYAKELTKFDLINDSNNPIYAVTNRILSKEGATVREAWGRFSSTPGMLADRSSRGSSSFLDSFRLSDGTVLSFDRLRGEKGSGETFFHAGMPEPLNKKLRKAGYRVGGRVRGFNRGGFIPGYAGGGGVRRSPGGSVRAGRMFYGEFEGTPLRSSIDIAMERTNPAAAAAGAGAGVASAGRRGLMRGMLGSTIVGIGGSMLGSSIGGPLGTAVSVGSGLASMGMMFGGGGGGQPGFFGSQLAKLPTWAKQPIGPLSNLAKASTSTANSLSGIGRAIAPVLRGFSAILRVASPLGLAITAVTAALGFGVRAYKDHQEQQRLARLEFGITGDAAKKAGLKFTDYNQTIKNAIENAKAVAERNRMIYESMTMSATPLKMTIEQYKKLRSTVKDTMGDYIKLFDQVDKGDVGTLATRLKAQFMAAGDSAETATAKIYALIAESNKSSQAASVIGSQAFKSIQTLQDAAAQSIKTFEGSLEASDLEGQAASLFSTFSAIDSAIADVVTKSQEAERKGKGTALTVGEAQKQVMDKLGAQFKNQTTLSNNLIGQIKKINPELGKVLNSTDTITSAWSKYQLIIRGVNVDLSTMTATAANAAMQIISSVDTMTTSYLKTNSATKGLYSRYNDLTARIKDLQKAAKGQSAQDQIDTRKAIENLNKRISKIKEAADAKIKALRSQAQAENDALEIQKLQLEYQQALARGDQDAAAQAQIALQQLNTQVQTRKAEENILAKAELQIKPLQDQIDALNKKNQELADKASLAGESIGKLQEQADKLKSNIDNLNSALSRVLINRLLDPTYAGSQRERDDIAAYRKAAGEAGVVGVPKKRTAPAKSPDEARSQYAADQQTTYGAADSLLKGLQSAIEKNPINAQNVTIYANQMKTGVAGSQVKVTPLSYTAPGGTKITANVVSASSLQAAGFKTDIGTVFTDQSGTKWKITRSGDRYLGPGNVGVTKARYGGVAGAGQPIVVGDAGRPELFIPQTNGIILPNLNNIPDLGPRFDIPTGMVAGGNLGKASNSFNNNTYNINIEMNGTNVTADDVVRRFKAELALINAREGRSRTIGGGY